MDRLPRERWATALGIAATTSVILPAFLTGAVAVQMRDAIGMSEADIGLAIGGFFVGSAIGSTHLGRLAERLGPVRAIQVGLLASVASTTAVTVLVDGPRLLQAILVLAGLGNALAQPGVNLLLIETVSDRRLGLAMALKQSGMPTAALLGGLAVPAVALTFGWRACFGLAAFLAFVAIVMSLRVASADPGRLGNLHGSDDSAGSDARPRAGTGVAPGERRPDQPLDVLITMAAVGVFGGGAANAVVGYLVSGAVDAGVAPGPAGLLLTFGSAIGVTSRLIHGWLVDRRGLDPLNRVIVLFGLGAAAALALSVHSGMGYLLATPFVFGAGWAWPGLFNFVVINANRSAPAAASGITQTGVYVGSVTSPIVTGLLIEAYGYQAAWWFAAALLTAAGGVTLIVRRRLRPAADPGPKRAEDAPGGPAGPPDQVVPSRRSERAHDARSGAPPGRSLRSVTQEPEEGTPR